jgi:hypothetical protein
MREVITGLAVQVEITKYTDTNQVAGRASTPDGKPIVFTAVEVEIPPAVVEWVREKIGMKGG